MDWVKEFRDRSNYFYLNTREGLVYPNSREGDLLRIAHRAIESLEQSLREAREIGGRRGGTSCNE